MQKRRVVSINASEFHHLRPPCIHRHKSISLNHSLHQHHMPSADTAEGPPTGIGKNAQHAKTSAAHVASKDTSAAYVKKQPPVRLLRIPVTPGKARAMHVKDVYSKDCQPAPQISVQLSNAFDTEVYGHYSATPDTGADASVIGLSMLEYLNLTSTQIAPSAPTSILVAKGSSLRCVGTLLFSIQHGSHSVINRVLVCMRGPRRSSPVMAHLPRSPSHTCQLPNTDHTITCRS